MRWYPRLSKFDLYIVHHTDTKRRELTRCRLSTTKKSTKHPWTTRSQSSPYPKYSSYVHHGRKQTSSSSSKDVKPHSSPLFQISPRWQAIRKSKRRNTDDSVVHHGAVQRHGLWHSLQVGPKPSTPVTIDNNGVLVQSSLIDSTSQRVAPTSLRPHFQHPSHHSLMDGHPGQRRLYDVMKMELYGPHKADDVYYTVRDCRSIVHNRLHGKWQRQLKQFFPEGLLEWIGMDMLRPVPKANQGRRFMAVMTDRYNRFTKVIPTAKTNATEISRSVLEHLVTNYGSLSKLLTDSHPYFLSKVFVVMYSTFRVNNSTAIEYYWQTSGRGAF